MRSRLGQTHARLEGEFERIVLSMADSSSPISTIMVTGLSGGEGCTTVVSGLARAFTAVTSKRLLLADGNLVSPAVHEAFALERAPGLGDWTGGELPIHRVSVADRALPVLTAGSEVPQSERKRPAGLIQRAVEQARGDYDVTIWDSAPMVSYPESLTLAKAVDGVLIVLEADRSKVSQLTFLKRELDRNKVKILGALFNRSGRFAL